MADKISRNLVAFRMLQVTYMNTDYYQLIPFRSTVSFILGHIPSSLIDIAKAMSLNQVLSA